MKEERRGSWLCSVVHVGIADFARLDPAQRENARTRLEALIQPDDEMDDPDRVVVDGGDGITLCFLGDPEDALSAAIGVRERMQTQAMAADPLRVRIGVHLGAVKVSRDGGGATAAFGDGLRSAQQLAGHAAPDQVLVSQSYYDVIASLSQTYAQSFRRLGRRCNLRGQECRVYEVAVPDRNTAGSAAADSSRGDIPPPADSPSTEMISYSTGWERAELTAAANAIEPYVGPLARVRVKEAAERATDVNHLYRLLAEYIPAAADREKFARAHGLGAGAPAAVETATMVIPPPEPPPASLDPVLLEAAEQRLVAYLGPLARVLVKKHAGKRLSVEEFLACVADELDGAQRREFLEAMRQVRCRADKPS